jgi:hypothetical protein
MRKITLKSGNSLGKTSKALDTSGVPISLNELINGEREAREASPAWSSKTQR